MGNIRGRPRLAVSRCLMGDAVRYDGKNAGDDYVRGKLARHFDLELICPETSAGLPSPRPPINLSGAGARMKARMEGESRTDLTLKLKRSSQEALLHCSGVCGYVLKSKSPSCAVTDAKSLNKGRALFGPGLFVTAMRRGSAAPMIDEKGLKEKALRANFIQMALVYRQWLLTAGRNDDPSTLEKYHNSCRMIAAGHGEKALAKWNRLSSQLAKLGSGRYIRRIMSAILEPSELTDRVFAMNLALKEIKGEAPGWDYAALKREIDIYLKGKAQLTPLLAKITEMARRAKALSLARQLKFYLEIAKKAETIGELKL